MILLALNMFNMDLYRDNSAEYIVPAMIALIVIVFITLLLIKFPITALTKSTAKNPFYKSINAVGLYDNSNNSGELCTLETKKHSILYRIIAILLSLTIFLSYLGASLDFNPWH